MRANRCRPRAPGATVALAALACAGLAALGGLAASGPAPRPGAEWPARDPLQPAQGRLLIARRELPDPNFAETVVLLVQYDERGAMGLILNRPTEASLATVLPGLDNAPLRRSRIFSGGPVSGETVTLLLRSDREPRESRRVFADVWVSRSRAVLEDLPDDVDADGTLRVYAGYAGWGAGQLESELDRGDWFVTDADPGIVFHASPRTLWHRLLPPDPGDVAQAVRPSGADERRRVMSSVVE